MNRQIVKLFGFIVVLFAVLVGFTSYWSVFDAEALKEKEANKRPLLEQQQIERGRILAADGTVIARSVAKGRGDALRYVRRYPEGALYGHPIGYSFVRQGTASSSSSTTTSWSATTRNSARSSTSCAARSRRATTSSPTSTRRRSGWRWKASKRPASAPWSRSSRARGRVRVLASNPPYDPNRVPYELERAEPERPRSAAGQPRHPGPLPAGLDLQGGDRRRRRSTAARSPRKRRSTRPARSTSRASRWQTTSTSATSARSRSTRADQLGQHLVRAARRTGRRGHAVRVHGQLRLQLDAGDRPARRPGLRAAASSSESELLGRGDPIDIARVAIGQERLLVTPLQMAEVAAAVANGGTLMKPQIWSRVVDPDGRVDRASSTPPSTASRSARRRRRS